MKIVGPAWHASTNVSKTNINTVKHEYSFHFTFIKIYVMLLYQFSIFGITIYVIKIINHIKKNLTYFRVLPIFEMPEIAICRLYY